MDEFRFFVQQVPRTDASTAGFSSINSKKAVKKDNLRQLKALGTPVARLDAEFTWEEAAARRPQDSMGLERASYLAKGATVSLTGNVGIYFGLTNGTTGVIIEIIYNVGTRPPALPKYVLTDFGEKYRGRSFFPGMAGREGWVPVYPTRAELPETNPTIIRTMIPLKLAFAWTPWMSQGRTPDTDDLLNELREIFSSAVVEPRTREEEERLSREQLTEKERLRRLAAETERWWRQQQEEET